MNRTSKTRSGERISITQKVIALKTNFRIYQNKEGQRLETLNFMRRKNNS